MDQGPRLQMRRLVRSDLAPKDIILISQLRITLDFLWELNFKILALINRLTNQLQQHIMSKNHKALKLWYSVLEKDLVLLTQKSRSLSQVPGNIYLMHQHLNKRLLALGLDLAIVQKLLIRNVSAQVQVLMVKRIILVKKERQRLWVQSQNIHHM